jgi:DNA-binding transcriptional MocR family regulator
MVPSWVPALSSGSGHRYRALAEAIRDAIQAGDLKPGDKLPPHREMAWKLGVTVTTVARAYNIAAEWGLVSARVGHGTRVREPGDSREPITLREGGERPGSPAAPSTVDFGLLLPTPLHDVGLRRQAFEAVFARIGRDLLDRSLSGYAPDLGYRAHREAGAAWLSHLGQETVARDIVVTRGAQEAFLLLLSMFTQPGDPVLVEEATYLGLSHLLRLRNHQMIPLPADHRGVVPDGIERRAKQSGAKLLFLCPNLQNPTGTTLSTERRHAIAEVAGRANLLVVENDPFAALTEGPRPPSLATLAPERTFYLASLSKCTGPAMRVCFMRCPQAHAQALEGVKHALTLGGAFLQAEIAAQWIRKGLLEELCAWQRGEIGRRWSLARSVLQGHMDDKLQPAPFVYLHLPEPWRAGEFVSAARQFSVTCIEADRFTVGRAPAPQAVRLALSSPATEAEVRRGLQTVADLLSTYSPAAAMRY